MSLHVEPEGAASAPSGESGLGARLDRLMQAAEREAAQIREAAERRAAVELTEAQEHATQLVEAAEEEAQRIRERAHLRARKISDAAEESVERLRRDAAHELERLTQLRDETRAEIQRLLRSLGGVRDALAYELDAAVPGAPVATPPQTRTADERSAGPAQPTPAVAAIGRRRGDLHRARLSGLSAAATDRAGDPSPG